MKRCYHTVTGVLNCCYSILIAYVYFFPHFHCVGSLTSLPPLLIPVISVDRGRPGSGAGSLSARLPLSPGASHSDSHLPPTTDASRSPRRRQRAPLGAPVPSHARHVRVERRLRRGGGGGGAAGGWSDASDAAGAAPGPSSGSAAWGSASAGYS